MDECEWGGEQWDPLLGFAPLAIKVRLFLGLGTLLGALSLICGGKIQNPTFENWYAANFWAFNCHTIHMIYHVLPIRSAIQGIFVVKTFFDF